MSRYEWPRAPSKESTDDDPAGRGRFMQRRRVEFDAERALSVARHGPGPRTDGPVARAPASGRTHLWQPLGPDTVVSNPGLADAYTRVAGRVNMLAVHSGGQRVYAASANGGVWHSADGGVQWRSLGGLASTPTPGAVTRPAHRNACGAIAVEWDTAAGDVVYVGTGETTHPHDAQPGRSLGGIGILRSVNPAGSTLPDPWVREAKNLLGAGVCRIALQPGGSGVVAATTVGLFERPAGAAADTDWQRVSGTPFSTLTAKCADALWTRGDGTRPERLWVWVQDGRSAGLWVRAAGQPNFEHILAVPTVVAARAVLAAADPATSPDQVYVFNDDGGHGAPRLFRVACASAERPTAMPVSNVPDVLGASGFYTIALALHPTRTNHVVLGGKTFGIDGAIVSSDVTVTGAGTLTFGDSFDALLPDPLLPFPKVIGAGVHPDIHDLVYSNGGSRLWAACDGGVYRSDRADSPVGFAAMNDGLGVIESNYIACHPACEGHVVAGLQDNGVISRRSGAVWNREGGGDGGGVAFDPTRPTRYLRQYYEGGWTSSDGVFSLALPAGENTPDRCAFYSTPAAIAKRRSGAPAGRQDIGQVIIGTSRVWYTEDFGSTWVTLPSGRAPPAGNLDQDSFGQKITVCRWQSPEVAWVLGEGRLRRYARTAGTDAAAGPGTWTSEVIIEKGVKPKKDTTSTDGPIRDSAVWTDIAVNLEPPAAAGQPPTTRGTRGALYLGTIGKAGSEDVDTLWWFDGSNRWHPTRLRAEGVPAPVTAIVCDPAFPEEVYVGTTIGVWKGVRTQIGDAAPAWTWHKRLNGLPEAAVEDLAIFSRDGLRLLRAGIASRGVWELRLDATDVADLTYVRAHDDDLRHRSPSVAKQRDGTTDRSWHGSPDVRPRRAPLACPAPPTLPWAAGNPGINAEQLRRFQSALRRRTDDRRIRPTGRWDGWFNEVMRDLGAPTVAPATVRLDHAFWDLSMQLPHATAEPWGSGRPSHADLLDFSAAIEEGVRERTSCSLPPDASKVDILVHHRGLAPLDGADVRVTLLKWVDPRVPGVANWSDSRTWFSGNVPWTEAVNEVLNSATGATTHSPGSGWSFVGTPATRRQTLAGQTLDALHPGIASFDLDLSGLAANSVVLLVAVIRAGADIALTADTLQNLAFTSPSVAVRSVRVNGTSVAAAATVSPFSIVPYATEMAPSDVQNGRLATAMQAVRTTLPVASRDQLDKAALIVAKLTPAGTMDYAGVRETEMFFSASLLKVVLLYANFELVARVNALAPSITATSPARFLDAVKRDFSPKIEGAVRRIAPGAWRKVSFSQALTATPSGAGQFRVGLKSEQETDLRKIFSEQDQNNSPRACMHRVGYSYVNRALEAAGFLDAEAGIGLWMATDYGDWSDFHVPVSTRSTGRNPRNGTSSAAMTALAMASLLGHLHRGQLIDAAASLRMRAMFEGGRGWSWFGQLSQADRDASAFIVTGCKVGDASSPSAHVGTVLSEAALLQRKIDSAPFLAVWQNVPAGLGFEPIYRVLDEMIRNWP